MPKFFDPSNYPKQSIAAVTIYPNKVILDGGGGGTLDISINGIKNTVIATYTGASYAATATAWVAANLAFYATKGFVVSNTTTGSASATIVATPVYGWDTVNRINITAPTIDTLSATFAGTFEPDLAKAKTWHVTFGCNISILRPKNMVNGDKIRLELNATGAYTTTFPTDSTAYYFPGGTEYAQTSTTMGTVTGTVNTDAFPREDRVTLTGSSGTANITAGGLKKLATWTSGSLSNTADQFVTDWAAAYLAIGLTVTAGSGVLTFKVTSSDPKAAANFYAIPTIANVTTNLLGTIVNVPRGRIVCDSAAPNIVQ